MLSLDDFNAMAHTMDLTSALNNARRLRESIARLRTGNVFIKKIVLDAAEENQQDKAKTRETINLALTSYGWATVDD
ncbi:hypothetical protein IFU04_24010 [Pseudomonas syringae]|nr:hypothetical protein [Pseudomonas syringae]MBD8577308.1 hypothetical protein [Pseudomonas syringae]